MPLPILCYHKVGPLAEEGRWLNVEPATLRSHIRFFKRRSFRFLQAADLHGDWPAKAVCLTFDDAYRSTMTHGIETMRQEAVTASIFAVSSQFGGNSLWDGDRAGKLAEDSLLVEAALLGFEIGNHTASHPRLSQLSPERQMEEIQSCHQALLDLNIHATAVAYPYGSFDANTLEAVRKLGYSVGLGLSRRPARPSDRRLALPRIVLSYGDRLPMLLYKLHLRPRLPSSKSRSDYVT